MQSAGLSVTAPSRELRAGLVSVVIPAYNAGTTLQATIDSVLAQTHRDLEVLIVDDGSQDATAEVAARAAARDPRIRVFRQANGGVAAARNAALWQARGELIAWLDADDLWHPRKLARQIAALTAAPVTPAFVYTGYRLIDAQDRIIPGHRPLSDVTGHTLCLQIATNFFSNISSVLTKTRLVRELGGHDERLRAWGMEGAEDLRMQLQLMRFGPALCCREALVGYRIHDGNMSRGVERSAKSNLKVLELAEADYPEVPGWVFAFGRARVVGYVPVLAMNGKRATAAALFARLLLGQPAATAMMAVRVGWHGLRHGRAPGGLPDPALGQRFPAADPATAPWQRPLLLTRRQERWLARADTRLASRAQSAPRPPADPEAKSARLGGRV